jgi:hypothetical protein
MSHFFSKTGFCILVLCISVKYKLTFKLVLKHDTNNSSSASIQRRILTLNHLLQRFTLRLIPSTSTNQTIDWENKLILRTFRSIQFNWIGQVSSVEWFQPQVCAIHPKFMSWGGQQTWSAWSNQTRLEQQVHKLCMWMILLLQAIMKLNSS